MLQIFANKKGENMIKRIISIIAVICLVLTVAPVIGYAAGLTLTKTPVGNTGAVIAVSGGSGTVTAVSSNTSVATVAVSGSTVTVTGVSGANGIVTVTVTRGSNTAAVEVPIGYTTFSFSGRTVTVYPGTSSNYEVIGIEMASETEYTGAEGTGEMTVVNNADGSISYTAASGYELSVGLKKKGGVYSANGSSDYGSIAFKKEATSDSTLLLDGLSLKSQFTAPLSVKKDSSAKAYVNVLLGTVNTLADAAKNNSDSYGPTTEGGDGSNQYYAESAVIKGKTASDLTIYGGGTLNVNAAAKNGIKVGANAHLTVSDSILNVTAPNAALSSENELLVSGGTLTLNASSGDAIKAADDTDTLGTVYITGGDITINAGDEGILARKDVYISGGTLDITCTGDGVKAEDGGETAGDVNISGGEFTIKSTGDGVSAFYLTISGGTFDITCANGYTNTSYNGDLSSTPSAKCLKSSVESTISGGTFTLSSPDDAVHSNGDLNLEGGTFTIRTRDDGLHADQVLNFGIRGASNSLLNVTVNNSYEGIEAADVLLNSGCATVYSTDDVINAANKNTSNYHFTINEYGGVYRLYTSGGDGIDSNGGAYFRGGDLEVYSSSNTSNDPLDTEDTLALYGGVTLGCGMNQMQGSPSAGIYVEFTNLSIYSGYSIVIKDSSGNVLKSTQAYFASSSNKATYLVFSHPALVSGNTYYLYINGSSSAKTGTATGSGVDITPWTDLDAGNTNVYERVTSITPGSRHIITNASASTSVYTLSGTTSVTSQQSTLSTVTGGYSFGTVNESNTWYIDDLGHIYNTVNGVNHYLYYTGSSSGWSSSYTLGLTTDVSSAAGWEVTASGTAAAIYATVSGGGQPGPGGPGGQPGGSTKLYLSCSSGTWRISTSSATCYVYAPAVAQAALTGTTYYVAETDEGFSMTNIMAETSISYRSSRSAAAQSVAWNSSHITYSWEPEFNGGVTGTYVLTVCYDGIAFGTVTVKIVGEDQTVIVTFVGDYTGTAEIAAGDTVPLPTAPEGYYYTFYLNGVEFDPSTPVYRNITITVVLHEQIVTVTVTFMGDYTGTVVIAAGETVTLPTAPEGYYYTFFVNGVEFDPSTPIYQDTAITVVLNSSSTEPTMAGDLDGNGRVEYADISLLAMYLNGEHPTITEQGMSNADANGDGIVDIRDIAEIYGIIAVS